MREKIVELLHGVTAIIRVEDTSSYLGWSVCFGGVELGKNVYLTLSAEEIWRFLWKLHENAKYYESKYGRSKEKEILEKYVPMEYFELAEKLKKEEWEKYESRYGWYPIRIGLTASFNPKYRPPIITFRGTFEGHLFEIRLTDLVDVARVAIELLDVDEGKRNAIMENPQKME